MGLRDLISVMRARAWIVVVTVAVVTTTALVVSFFVPPTYQGEATVLLTQQNTGSMLLGSPQQYLSDLGLQREVQTQVNVMQSRGILEQVIKELKLNTTPASLLTRMNVRFDGQTDVVTIDVEDRSAARAADTANALAEAYVSWSLTRQRASIKAAADDVEQRLGLAQRQIVDIQGRVSAGDQSAARQVELRAANDLYGTLANQLAQLKINEQLATGSGSVLASATVDPVAVSPKPARNGALALVMGLILGLGIAFVTEALDNTIKSSDEAEELYGAPVLCSIPADKRKKREDAPRHLTLVDDPGSPAAEAYRMLRNNLGFINFEHDIRTILVTSASPNEGKSTVAANLATVLSRAGKNVVLVSCDFHQPGSAQLFHVSGPIGLSDILRGTVNAKQVVEHPKDLDSLGVISAGNKPPNPSELLGSSAMGALVSSLRDSADWVILDSAPLLAVADAAAAARWVDGVLMVTRSGVSTRDAARKGREQLENVGARILGVVLWGREETSARGGYDGYYADYGTPRTG